MPLWAGIATKQQSKIMIYEHLLNPNEFWVTYPIATLARNEKGYSEFTLQDDIGCNWRANMWIPTNFMIYQSLKNYGYDEIASIISYKTKKLLEKEGSCEYYTSETGKGQGQKPFWGWSLLGFIMEDCSIFLEKTTSNI
jgi:neutral trehalase